AAFSAKCTHGSVIRAIVDYLLIAVGKTGSVAFGNAPLQSCRWDQVLADTGARSVIEFYRAHRRPVSVLDLRGYVIDQNSLGAVRSTDLRPSHATVDVDLGQDSRLEHLDDAAFQRFRVSDYNPAITSRFHAPKHHVYSLNRSVLEADVIMSVPK